MGAKHRLQRNGEDESEKGSREQEREKEVSKAEPIQIRFDQKVRMGCWFPPSPNHFYFAFHNFDSLKRTIS